MSKDLHEKPFDETTIAKLEIFEDYALASHLYDNVYKTPRRLHYSILKK